ncbi:hypothetical protein JCM8097_004497 [Rhodosporidiobolus ruineniae]
MDLDALRAAALQTKKRKRAAQLAAASAPDDLEEGEIDDAPPPSQSTPATAYPHPTRLNVHAIKEESKATIAELLTYGVPPDYLLSIGVSRDILEISFHELNLDLSLPPAPPPAFVPPPIAPHVSLLVQPPVLSPSVSPTMLAAAPPPNAPTAPRQDLAALEARKRAELLARKAALSARNQQRAHSLESELDSLFAAASASASPTPPPVTQGNRDGDEPHRKRAKLERTASAAQVHALREAVDDMEEVAFDDKNGGGLDSPFPPTRDSSGGADSVAQSSARVGGSALPPSRRPVATDFEAEATSKMSLQALEAQRGPGGASAAYIPRTESVSMIIELSDDEDEEDEEDASGTRSTSGDAQMSDGRPPPTASTSKAAEDEAEAVRRRELEEKDRELQRLKERIAAIERKKKEDKAKKEASAEPVAVAVAPKTVVVPPTPKKGKKKGKERAKEPDPEREQESGGAEEEAPVQADGAAPATGNSRSTSPTRAIGKSSLPQPTSSPFPPSSLAVFRPYQSSLARFPLIRSTATAAALSTTTVATSSASSTPSSSSSTPSVVPSSEIANSLGSAGVASWAARKHGVDAAKRLCKAEASGGKCADPKCKAVHVAQFVPTADELAEYASLSAAGTALPSSVNGNSSSNRA